MSGRVEQVGFPLKMVRGLDALQELGAVCQEFGKKTVFITGGKTALEKVGVQIKDSLTAGGIRVCAETWYGGECSWDNVKKLAQEANSCKADVIVAVGGGKALDTGKMVGDQCKLPVITIPTIAATCAAITPVSVAYNEKGEFLDIVSLSECPISSVIDTKVILHAPVKWLAAGMGDTLAKWYEYRVSIQKAERNSMTLSALANGKLCYDLVEEFGGQARQAVESRTFHTALDATVDAIILYAGLASIFGGEKIRSAAAHAFYNGFTRIPAAHNAGHGFVVGYGNLILLALENRSDQEILEAAEIARRCAVPVAMSEILSLSSEELQTVSAAAVAAPDMDNMPFPVNAAMVIQAVHRVDELTKRLA